MKKTNIRKLTVSAILIALGAVLSLIKPFPPMPLGGSVTLFSMVPITLIAVMFGTRWGLFSAFVYSLVQIGLDVAGMMAWGMDARMWVGAIIFDYLVAYTVIGFSGLFKKRDFPGICFGICLALSLRFISHFISGCIFFSIWSPWDNPYIYSICYNGAYMLPELVFTLIAVTILYKTNAIKRLLNEVQ